MDSSDRPDYDQIARNFVDEGNKLLRQGNENGAIEKYDQAIRLRPYKSIAYFNRRNALSRQKDIPSTEEDNVNQLNNRVKDSNSEDPSANTYFVMSTIAAVPEHEFSNDSSDEDPDEEFDKSFNNNNFLFTTTKPEKNPRPKKKAQILKMESTNLNQRTDSIIVDPFLSEVSKNGFEEYDKDKLPTIAISIALNRMKSLSTRKNNSLILELQSKVSTTGIKCERFGFYWKCAWYTRDGKEAKFEAVRSYYKKLKKKNSDLAKKFIKQEENEGAELKVPYQELREYAKNHEKTKKLIKAFRDEDPNSNIYLHLVDLDVQDFNGVYSAYLRIIHGCCETPTIMSTGYEFPEEPENKAFHLLSPIDRMCRVITTFNFPLGTYYSESNMCILIPKEDDTVKESFIDHKRGGGKTLESPILLKNIQENRQNVSAIFSEDSPIITSIPERCKRDKQTKQLLNFSRECNESAAPTFDDIKRYDQVNQSHSNISTWSMNLFINRSIKYDNNSETAGRYIYPRNIEPLKSAYQQCEKLIKNIYSNTNVGESKSELAKCIGDDNANDIVETCGAINQYKKYFNEEIAKSPNNQKLINIMRQNDEAQRKLAPGT